MFLCEVCSIYESRDISAMLILFPDDVPFPLASNLNFVPGTVAPNAFIVALGGGDGGYNLYASMGGLRGGHPGVPGHGGGGGVRLLPGQ